jgi:hypothetical protein
VAERTLALARSLPVDFKQLYGHCFVSDNEFGIGDNNLITEHLALTSNSFGGAARVGITIVNAATYVGNYAGNPDRTLFSAAQASERVANLAITIRGR